MPIFDNIIPEPDPSLVQAAFILNALNSEIFRRIQIHKDLFERFWTPSEVDNITPDSIAEQMRTHGGLFFALSQESIRHILTGLALCGLDSAVYFPPESYTPPREITVNEDGTITIGPAE